MAPTKHAVAAGYITPHPSLRCGLKRLLASRRLPVEAADWRRVGFALPFGKAALLQRQGCHAEAVARLPLRCSAFYSYLL